MVTHLQDNVTIVQTEYRQMTAEEIGDLFDGEADGDAWITAAKNSTRAVMKWIF